MKGSNNDSEDNLKKNINLCYKALERARDKTLEASDEAKP